MSQVWSRVVSVFIFCLFFSCFIAILRRCLIGSYFHQMVSECKDQSGHLCGVPAVWAGHVLLSDQEPLLHQILKRQQLSVRPGSRHSAPRQWDGFRYEEGDNSWDNIHLIFILSGHYTAFATNSQAWFNFNDVNVKETDFQNVQSSKAYILFYVQRDFNRAMNSWVGRRMAQSIDEAFLEFPSV